MSNSTSQQPAATMQIDHSYAGLPEVLFELCAPTPVAAPRWLAFNHPLAAELGFDPALAETAAGLQLLAGNQLPGWTKPLAQAYSGHQFGHLSPRLGDGRALLLAEIIDKQQRRRDIQLKGAGPTPYSRRGDGRSALGPVIREYLVSEAMFALGVPTSRALAAVITGETVYRDQPKPGGILTRVAASHIRIGTFQFASMLQDGSSLKSLADYVINRHYPACADRPQPYLALLNQVIRAQAALVAQWMSLGFIHGVMNTDNMSVSGETIDYGPCAFIDQFDPNTVFSSIDQQGRYAYRNQPMIAQWNLARLAEALLPLLAESEAKAVELATAALNEFPEVYYQAWQDRMSAKLGLASTAAAKALAEQLLQLMAANNVDFTIFFRKLAFAVNDTIDPQGPAALVADQQSWLVWAAQWQQQLSGDPAAIQHSMNAVNPYFIPRNHQIELIISQVTEHNDFTLFQQFARDLTMPFTETTDNQRWAATAPVSDMPYRTFCGT
jgi:serine/tyrosine/threonine adenylyltransferase